MEKKQNPVRGSLLLLLTATIWGVAFVAQSVGMEYVGPFTFNSTRSVIGFLVLLPVSLWLDRRENKTKAKEDKKADRTLLTGGVVCGILLFLASNFQQFGIKYSTVGKAGFITAFYIILVPIIGNAAEHSTAIIMAVKDKMNAAIEIALGSSLQIILFVIPVLVLLSLFFTPMSIVFTPFELVAVASSVIIADRVSADGESNWLEGLQLVIVYLIIGAAFFFV